MIRQSLLKITAVKKCSDWLMVFKSDCLIKRRLTSMEATTGKPEHKKEEIESRKNGMDLMVGGGGESGN